MASTAKTLTFVIPAYNMESYLDRCVNSLLSASDISDLEVLIVTTVRKTARWSTRASWNAPIRAPCARFIRRTRATAAR